MRDGGAKAGSPGPYAGTPHLGRGVCAPQSHANGGTGDEGNKEA